MSEVAEAIALTPTRQVPPPPQVCKIYLWYSSPIEIYKLYSCTEVIKPYLYNTLFIIK